MVKYLQHLATIHTFLCLLWIWSVKLDLRVLICFLIKYVHVNNIYWTLSTDNAYFPCYVVWFISHKNLVTSVVGRAIPSNDIHTPNSRNFEYAKMLTKQGSCYVYRVDLRQLNQLLLIGENLRHHSAYWNHKDLSEKGDVKKTWLAISFEDEGRHETGRHLDSVKKLEKSCEFSPMVSGATIILLITWC